MNPGLARALAAGVVLWWCAGCAALLPATPGRDAAAFDVLGRVLASQDGRAFSAGFRWRHVPPENEIWLMTPTGTTLAHIAVDAIGATLTTADQQEYRASSVEALTRRALGWPLPLAQLQYWIHGEVVPGLAVDAAERGADGRLVSLTQDAWNIRYGYPDVLVAAQRPRLLDLLRDGQRIRLVIDEWRGLNPQ